MARRWKRWVLAITLATATAAVALGFESLHHGLSDPLCAADPAMLGLSAAVTFDFDTGSPALVPGQNIPMDQTSGGVTAHFSSPLGAAYSVQSQTTFPSIVLSQFSGNYLFDNDVFKSALDISFSRSLTGISFTFATVEYHGGPGVEPSNVQLTAYLNSMATTPVGSAVSRGIWPTSDTYPQGTLSFDSGGSPFNLVRIEIPYQPEGASNFLADNVSVNAADNSAPVATDDAYTTSQNTPLAAAAPGVLINDTDADGNALTAILVASVGHGTLTLNSDGSFVYVPSADFSGADSFTYKANDGTADSNVAAVSITVSAGGNVPPVAVDDAYTTNQGQLLNQAAPGILANDTDANGNALTAILIVSVSHGSLTLNSSGSFTYTPAANFNGSDSFTYKASDGMAASNVATVSIAVSPVSNAAPLAMDDSYSVVENAILDMTPPGVLANDSDVDGDPLTAILANEVGHGTLTFRPDGSFTYTPSAHFKGADSFAYKANDGPSETLATVSITVTQTAPIIVSISPSSLRLSHSGGVTVSGADLDGATAVSFGDGITVDFIVDNPGQITADITIDPAAAAGTRDVTVVTPGGSFTLAQAFTVRAPSRALSTWVIAVIAVFGLGAVGSGIYVGWRKVVER